MRLNPALSQKILRRVDGEVLAALKRLENRGACAGISKNPAAARKARINHHGSFSKKVPARPFINAGLHANIGTDYIQKMRDLIAELLSNDQDVARSWYTQKFFEGTSREYAEKMPIRGKPFGAGVHGYDILYEIAQTLADAQRDAILSRRFVPNSPRTIKKKKAKQRPIVDMPLVDTGRMLSSIKGWVE